MCGQFDVVVDSLVTERAEIMRHSAFAKASSEAAYAWRQNHMAGAGSGVMVAFSGVRFLSGISTEMKRSCCRSNVLRFVPSLDRNTQRAFANSTKENALDLT